VWAEASAVCIGVALRGAHASAYAPLDLAEKIGAGFWRVVQPIVQPGSFRPAEPREEGGRALSNAAAHLGRANNEEVP